MKKYLFLFMVMAACAVSKAAEVTSPYKGCEVGNMTDVFLYNVSTGMFLQTNRRDATFWTTRAQLDVSGKDLDITSVDGGWQINPKLGGNHSMNDFNLYFDTSQPVTAWVFTPVETTDGTFVYTITSGSYALGARNVNGKDGKPLITNMEANFIEDGGLWQIVTTDERLQVMQKATETEPQDASWMIQGYDFAANDERNSSWQGLSGNYAITADNKAQCNRILEYWTLTDADVYQELLVPNGVYEVWANGCYSPTGASELSQAHLQAYTNGSEPVCGYIYANDEMVPMVDLYAEAQSAKVTNCMEKQIGSYWIPAGNGQISASFFNGYYRPESFRVNVVDEKIRIGAKVIDGTGTSWIIVDNFTLTYLGNNGKAFQGHMTPSPADNANIDFDDIDSLSIRFDGASTVAAGETSRLNLVIKGADGETLAHADISNASFDGRTMSVTPTLDVINYGGVATVSIDGEVLIDGEPFVIGTEAEPYTFTWNVKEKILPYIPAFTITPDNSEMIRRGQLGSVKITFSEAESVSFVIDALARISTSVSDAFFGDWSQDGNTITMTFSKIPQVIGEAALVIEGGSIVVDGRKVDEIDVTYSISDEDDECEALDVANAVDNEGRLAVCPQNSAFTIASASETTITRVMAADGNFVAIALPTSEADGYFMTVYPLEDTSLAKGTYTMTLAEGLLTLTDGTELRLSARRDCTFSVGESVKFPALNTTSIRNIHNADTDVVYNLNGQRIATPQRGVNIINGRKVIK